jgi:N-acetylneuraminic acid mutarotase
MPGGLRRSLPLLLFVAAAGVAASLHAVGQTRPVAIKALPPANVFHGMLTFAQRVAYQRAIEDVYWRHRIWPKECPDPKPPLDAVISQAQLEKKVANYLHKSQALEDYWQRPLTAEELQAEMDRMAHHTKQPEVLRELFEVLGSDPFVIAECLVRPVLSERFITKLYAYQPANEPLRSSITTGGDKQSEAMETASVTYVLPTISDAGGSCSDDSWTATSTSNAPSARGLQTGVWTGSEMIVWGGIDQLGNNFNTGGRYSPATDSWAATSTTNAPAGRVNHAAVWTGNEMIMWGGAGDSGEVNTGGKYNPATDRWIPTSSVNAPSGRQFPTAVWSGGEMIVWGGVSNQSPYLFNTGGKYNPNTDTWTATSIINAPAAREGHSAVWTGSEMIVWGGDAGRFNFFNTGGRYNPITNSWTATSTTNAPSARALHTAVWSDSEMIVWGGGNESGFFNTGGRYDPITDTWTATRSTNAPSARYAHTAVWSGNEMIVWGGNDNTGGRYNPITNSWIATSTTNAPAARGGHIAVWTGTEMIVWGGSYLNTGGRYCAQSGPTPTPSPRPSPTPRRRPTPSPRPTL